VLIPFVAGLAGLATATVLGMAAVGGATVDNSPTCEITAMQEPVGTTPLSLSQEQIGNAQVIVAVGQAMGMPARAYVIALATALQESRLRNLDYGDRDSLGLFQQRPSQGWGGPSLVRDPEYAAARFYQALDRVDGWQRMPLTEAAQAVQRSAVPNAYAKWEPLASTLVSDAVGSTVSNCVGLDGDGLLETSGSVDGPGPPSSYSIPSNANPQVQNAIAFALSQIGKPYRLGADGPDAYDCSSLLQAAYAYAGIRIGSTTLQQVHDGTAVWPPSAVMPGDLVFIPGSLGTRSAPRHVGMYIGEGLIVNAPRTGDVVRVRAIADWSSEIVAIRRVAP